MALAAVRNVIGNEEMSFLSSEPLSFPSRSKDIVTIFDKYTLDAIENRKLQRLKECLLPFMFTTEWRRGRGHSLPDA